MGRAKFNMGMEFQGHRGQGLGWGLETWVYDSPSPDIDPDQCIPHWSLSLQGPGQAGACWYHWVRHYFSQLPFIQLLCAVFGNLVTLHPLSSVSWVSFIPNCPSGATSGS